MSDTAASPIAHESLAVREKATKEKPTSEIESVSEEFLAIASERIALSAKETLSKAER